MDGKEILDKFKSFIDTYAEMGCSVHQAGYKDDFFRLFLEAHKGGWFDVSRSPRLTGDAMMDYYFGYWLIEKNEVNTKREEYLREVLAMWDEWHYALKKTGN